MLMITPSKTPLGASLWSLHDGADLPTPYPLWSPLLYLKKITPLISLILIVLNSIHIHPCLSTFIHVHPLPNSYLFLTMNYSQFPSSQCHLDVLTNSWNLTCLTLNSASFPPHLQTCSTCSLSHFHLLLLHSSNCSDQTFEIILGSFLLLMSHT
jgi:hypothetical protein